MIFETLSESAEKGELMLVNGGMCHWHLRRDGQLTIREIISTIKGAGTVILNRLLHTLGAKSIFAKCPIDLSSNGWYQKKGFCLEGTETTPSGRVLNLWRKGTDLEPATFGGVELFYCAGGNSKLAQIAIDYGLNYGSQLPETVYFRPAFCDQDWKKPDREKYMQGLAKYRPAWATVLDLEQESQLEDVMSWATEASQHVHKGIIIIPKVKGIVASLPRVINGKHVRLGYSVPTAYGGTTVPPIEFANWDVHLLGGSPKNQLAYTQLLNVVSADCNYIQKIAVKFGDYWHSERGRCQGTRLPYEVAFEQSVQHYIKAWQERASKPVQGIFDFLLEVC